jgi:hypothetical protein
MHKFFKSRLLLVAALFLGGIGRGVLPDPRRKSLTATIRSPFPRENDRSFVRCMT